MADDPLNLTFTLRLQDDFNRCVPKLHNEDEKDRRFWRRTAYRSFFEATEAWMTVNRKHFVPVMLEERQARLAEDARNAVAELMKRKDGTCFQRFEANVRLCLILSEYELKKVNELMEEPVFDIIKKAVSVRNRIAHPNKDADYEVSDHETESLMGFMSWFDHFFRIVKYGDGPAILIDDEHLD